MHIPGCWFPGTHLKIFHFGAYKVYPPGIFPCVHFIAERFERNGHFCNPISVKIGHFTVPFIIPDQFEVLAIADQPLPLDIKWRNRKNESIQSVFRWIKGNVDDIAGAPAKIPLERLNRIIGAQLRAYCSDIQKFIVKRDAGLSLPGRKSGVVREVEFEMGSKICCLPISFIEFTVEYQGSPGFANVQGVIVLLSEPSKEKQGVKC